MLKVYMNQLITHLDLFNNNNITKRLYNAIIEILRRVVSSDRVIIADGQ